MTAVNIPPTRLCVCGHNLSVHRGAGPCKVASRCPCQRFTDAGPDTTHRDGQWLGLQHRPRPRPARDTTA